MGERSDCRIAVNIWFPVYIWTTLGHAEKVTGMPTVRRPDADVYEYLKERQQSRRYACV